MTVSAINTVVETALSSSVEQSPGVPDLDDAQSISGRNIDPNKLTMLLRVKFGAGAYDVHIMQNSYCIIAPRRLSTGEIAKCRKR
ncbi:hypothetical protein ACET3X_005890 [Alternaria dauci]|uniref:Uncharacterized protein n=1 Tax=Alternaria dauci TaxID=48095 RepID=A0ABR3UJG7_9PLEO